MYNNPHRGGGRGGRGGRRPRRRPWGGGGWGGGGINFYPFYQSYPVYSYYEPYDDCVLRSPYTGECLDPPYYPPYYQNYPAYSQSYFVAPQQTYFTARVSPRVSTRRANPCGAWPGPWPAQYQPRQLP